jgi:hypothetical protein
MHLDSESTYLRGIKGKSDNSKNTGEHPDEECKWMKSV